MNLMDVLPLIDGWEYSVTEFKNPFVVDKGTQETIDKKDRPGWVLSAFFSVDTADTELKLKNQLSGGRTATLLMSPDKLFNFGLTAPNNFGRWVSVYDDVNSVYTVNYTPSVTLPFRNVNTATVKAPSHSDVTVYTYGMITASIFDRDKVLTGFQEVFGTGKMMELLSSALSQNPEGFEIGSER